MLKESLLLTVVFSALMVDATPQIAAHGTVIVVALTQEGIVVGADLLRGISSTDDATKQELKPIKVPKFAMCGPQTVCSSSGLAEIEFNGSPKSTPEVRRCGHFEYRFNQWISRIEDNSRGTEEASPALLANLIWEKARSTFDPIECFMRTKQGQFLKEGDGPVMFLVAGYAKSSELPELYAVRIQVDQKKMRLRYPAPEKLFPDGPEKGLPTYFGTGDKERFQAVGKEREPVTSLFREYFSKRITRVQLLMRDAPPAFQEAVAAVASYIDVESKFNEKVGGGSSIMLLRRGKPPEIINMPELNSGE